MHEQCFTSLKEHLDHGRHPMGSELFEDWGRTTLCQPLSFVRVKGPKGLVVWPVGMVLVRDTGWVCRTALQA